MTSQSLSNVALYKTPAHSSVQNFGNDCDAIFVQNVTEHGFHRTSVS